MAKRNVVHFPSSSVFCSMDISPPSQHNTGIYFSYPVNATHSYVCSLSVLEEKLTEDRPLLCLSLIAQNLATKYIIAGK